MITVPLSGGRSFAEPSAFRGAAVTVAALFLLISRLAVADTEAEKRARAWMRPAIETGSEIFQYHVESKGSKGRTVRSWLWIPPSAEKVRGLIYAGDLMMESNFVVDPTIRKACEEQAIAILFSKPQLPLSLKKGDFTGGAQFAKALADLGEMSGHPEAATVPIMPLGHSAASPRVGQILRWNPDRCFGAVTYKGAHPIPTDGSVESLRGIPNIHIQDYVDEYKNRRDTGSLGRMNVLSMRAKDTDLLMGIIEDCGSKHAAWCFRLTPLIADELRQAEKEYPAEWIEDAFREAVSLNKRSWKYIRAILERWRVDGRGDEAGRRSDEAERLRYIEGEYGDYIEH